MMGNYSLQIQILKFHLDLKVVKKSVRMPDFLETIPAAIARVWIGRNVDFDNAHVPLPRYRPEEKIADGLHLEIITFF